MKMSRFLLTFLFCISSLNSCEGVTCQAGWSQFGRSCYKYFDMNLKWEEAREHCLSEKANLVSIHSKEENDFLREITGSTKSVWVGGQRSCPTCEDFKWSDGTPWDFNAWQGHQPDNYGNNEACLEINWPSGGFFGWNDAPCHQSGRGRFVCKKSERATTSTASTSTSTGKIQKNHQLATIEEWGPLFKVSFDLMIHSNIRSDWSSVLAFRGNGAENDFSQYGDRAPAIFYNKAGYLHFGSAVSGDLNLHFNYDIELNKLYHIEIAQEELKMDGKVFYTVTVDGKIIKRVENTDARAFKDVKVFAGDNFYDPADGSYSSLYWQSFATTTLPPTSSSSELGNGSPRPRPRPRPRPGPKTCPRECFDRTVELLKTKCEGPNPAAIIKCVFKGTSDSVKPCLPCVCENICKAVTKGGPIYNLCTACRPPSRA